MRRASNHGGGEMAGGVRVQNEVPKRTPSRRVDLQSARQLRVAMIGARGVPAAYSGVERAVESLGAALVQRGHHVTVYCRGRKTGATPGVYRGMRLLHIPVVDLPNGMTTFLHAFLSTIKSLRNYDIIHYNALGPNLFAPIARMFSSATVVTTVHGRDDKRAKWGRVNRIVLRWGALISARYPHATIVVSQDLQQDYREEFDRDTSLLYNSLDPIQRAEPGTELQALGLMPGQYVVYIGRLVAEKDLQTLIRAYRQLPTELPLLIVGELDPADEYCKYLAELAAGDSRLRLIGARYGKPLAELFTSARLYISPSTLEGMPFALSEALQYGVPVVVSDIGAHRELLGTTGPGRHLVPVGSVSAMAASIASCLATEQAAVADVRQWNETTSLLFQPEAIAAKAEDIYLAARHKTAYRRRAT